MMTANKKVLLNKYKNPIKTKGIIFVLKQISIMQEVATNNNCLELADSLENEYIVLSR